MKQNTFTIDYCGYLSQFDPIFKRPIREGYHALPVGNGDMTAVMWQPDDLHIMFNKSNIGSTSQVAELTIETDTKLADKVGLVESRVNLYESVATMEYTGGDYPGRPTWIYRGVPGAPPKPEPHDLGEARAECYIPHGKNVALLNYTHRGEVAEPLRVRVRRWIQPEFKGSIESSLVDGIGVVRYIPDGEADAQEFSVAIACISSTGEAEVGEAREGDERQIIFTLPAHTEHNCRILVSVVTEDEADDTLAAACSVLRESIASDEQALRRAHREAREEFWSQFFVDAGHPYLNALYHIALYELSITSQGARPVQFNGALNLWNDKHRCWPGGFWCHNQSSVFQPVYAANHYELADNFHDWICEVLPQAVLYAKGRFNSKGAVYAETMAYRYDAAEDLKRPFDPSRYDVRLILSSGVRYVLLMWQRFKHSQDRQFLAEKLYPVARECINFYRDYAKKGEDGLYHIGPAVCWEEEPVGYDAHSDCAAWRALFALMIEAATLLERDADALEEWRECLEHAPHYPVDEGLFSLIMRSDGTPEPSDRYQWQLPNLSSVYPFSTVNIDSEKGLCDLAAATYARYKFNADAGHEYLPVIAARLGDAEAWRSSMFLFIQYMQNFDQGLFNYYNSAGAKDEHDGNTAMLHPYLEGSGIMAAAVNEMLLHSHGDLIRVFPAIPRFWSGRFTLSAEGGYLVSSECQKGNEIGFIRVVVDKGDHRRLCRIALPWDSTALYRNDELVMVSEERVVAVEVERGDILFCTDSENPQHPSAEEIGMSMHYSPCRFGNVWIGNKDEANSHNPGFPLW